MYDYERVGKLAFGKEEGLILRILEYYSCCKPF